MDDPDVIHLDMEEDETALEACTNLQDSVIRWGTYLWPVVVHLNLLTGLPLLADISARLAATDSQPLRSTVPKIANARAA